MKNIFKFKAIRRIAGIIALAAVIGFSMTACPPGGGDANVVGTWSGTHNSDSTTYVLTFNADLTWTVVVNGSSNFSGTYSVSGNTVTIVTSNGGFSAGSTFEVVGDTLVRTNVTLTKQAPDFIVSTGLEWKTAREAIRDDTSGKTSYLIQINGDFAIEADSSHTGTNFFGNRTGITVTLTGTGKMTPQGSGNVLNLVTGQKVIMDGPTLDAIQTTVTIAGGAQVELKRGKIQTRGSYDAVNIGGTGTFTMNGGEISRSGANTGGSGVYIAGSSSIFTMNGGEISGFSSVSGGGVWVNGTFAMKGGEIKGNHASSNGGGVHVTSNGAFTMTGGTIYGSTAGAGLANTGSNAAVNVDSGGSATNGGSALASTNDTVVGQAPL